MKKDLQISELIDIYGELLTSRQSETLRSYYDYDFSLSEIAENQGVTRQAVRDTIVKACEQLVVYEEKLVLKGTKERNKEQIAKTISLIEDGNYEDAVRILEQLLSNL